MKDYCQMLSVIIPSYKDPLLKPTVESLLTSAEGKIEVIAVLDGYELEDKLMVDDPRVMYVHLGENRGMRGAINAGVRVAKGDYLMRTDEHALFGLGYDVILTSQMRDNWIVTPRRYFLDPIKWEVMDAPPVDYMKLKIINLPDGHKKFSGVDWPERAKTNANKMIDQTMAMQGSCWVMKHTWWDKIIGELQTAGYGPLNQDSHEMQFKTWQAGGKLVVNKNTWHAHKHRKFQRTHNNGTKENPANVGDSGDYAVKVWGKYYEDTIKKIWKL